MSLPLWGLDRITTEALGWTLVHFLWQGALIAAGLCALDVVLGKSRATVRYTAACLAFTMMLLVPIGTFFLLRAETERRPQATHVMSVAPMSSARISTVGREPAVRRASTLALPAAPIRLPSLSRWLPWVVELWTLGVVAFSLRLLGGWWLVRRLVRSSANVTLEAWQGRLSELARRIGVSRPVRLCRSALVEVPTAVGWLRPMILLPATTLTGLAPAQIEAILAHELAHIRRHDYLVNLLQNLVEMLLFYHPAVWWVSRRVREERELCCDDLAIRVSGDPVEYARTLCELERLRGAGQLALAANGGSLATRIARLLGLPRQPWESWTRGLVGAFGASAVVVLLALGGLGVKTGRANGGSGHVPVRSVTVSRPAVMSPPPAPCTKARPAECDAPKPAEAAAPLSPSLLDLAPVAIASTAVSVAVTAVAPAVASTVAPTVSVTAVVASAPCPQTEDAAGGSDSDRSRPDRFSSSEWERLRQHGVSSEYVRNLEPNLPGLTADQLVALADHGVSSKYVANLKRAGLDHASVDDLIRLASHGVSSEYVGHLRGIDPDDMSVDELIRLASNGVTSNWYSAMQWMGLSEFSVDRAIQLHNVGVTAEYANKLKLVTHRHLTLEELRRLATQGVTSDYAARMYVLLGSTLDVEKLVQLQNRGVSSDYAEQMMVAAGPLGVEDLIQLHDQGVEPGYAYEMSVLGRLDSRDLIRLRQNLVSTDFVEEARAKGYQHPSVSELIQLRQRGLPDRTEQ